MDIYWFTIYGYLKKENGAVDFDHMIEKENINIEAITKEEAQEKAREKASDYFSKDKRISITGARRQIGKH